jgi:hypothetical protein
LAGVLKPQFVKEICTLLVTISGKATEALAGFPLPKEKNVSVCLHFIYSYVSRSF